MAFDRKALSRIYQCAIGAGDMLSTYAYGTADAAATVETANYFTDKGLKKGDVITASMVRSGTPVVKTYVVTAVNASGQATIALQATTAG